MPSTPRYIRHVTLTTGHVRDSLPDEVAPATIAAMRHLIERICAGAVSEPVSLREYADVGAYSVSGRCSGKCLVVSVYADGPPSDLICTIGVAAHSRCGASLWRNLHQWGRVPVRTDPTQCPPEPWVAAALDAGVAQHLGAMEWLGDMERCLAWAWVSRCSRAVR